MRKFFERFRSRLILRRYEVIFIGSVLLLSGAVKPSSWDPPVSGMPRPEVMLPRHPWIALTFDDGPHPVMTARLLAVLEKEQVPATFFVVGKMAERYPDVIQDMARNGFEVANHTYSHTPLKQLDDEGILNELGQTRTVIHRLTGRDCPLFRPPGGGYSRRIVLASSKAGYHMILWSVLTNDVQGASQRQIFQRVMKGSNDGGVILMHSGIENTVEVLPRMISALRNRGYHFVTVSQLMGLPMQPYAPIDVAPASVQTASRKITRRSVIR
jgi:peptidoglycan/xylan/chitin deacetylase (PgdA/CDA1 family)